MEQITTNTSNEVVKENIPSTDQATSGYIQGLDDPETLEDVATAITTMVDQKTKASTPMNRAQRRAAIKAQKGKKKLGHLDDLVDNIKKVNYIKLIEDLRKLNEQKEQENNETDQNAHNDI